MSAASAQQATESSDTNGKGERVLLTGGAGFIGSTVAEHYLAAGFAVTILDDLSSGRREHIPTEASFVHCGVNDPKARELLASGEFTILNHHAAQIDVRVSVANPLLDERINIAGLINLLEGAREGNVRRVVFASSGGVVYGESDSLPHDETAPKLPVSPYGVSKLASEYYLAYYNALYGLEAVNLRYSNVFGPRQSPHGEAGVVAIFGNRIINGQALTIFGDGTQTRDYVFVDDVATANVLAATGDLPAAGSIDSLAFNVGTGVETSVNELAQALLDATGTEIPIQHRDARPGELQRSAVNPARLMDHWGWSPRTTLVDGLKSTFDWIAQHA